MTRRAKKCLRQTPESFWQDVNKTTDPDGCWEWMGYIGAHGYGALTYQNKSWRAHRLSYILTYGELPITNDSHGTCVLHKCDNRKCVNPSHLFAGTQADNLRDMRNKNRQWIPEGLIGSKNNASKLIEKDIPLILKMSNQGMSTQAIANEFNVSKVCIHFVVTGKTWTHVNREAIKEAE